MGLAKELAEQQRALSNPYADFPCTFAHQAWELERAQRVLYYEWVALLRVDRLAEWLVRRWGLWRGRSIP